MTSAPLLIRDVMSDTATIEELPDGLRVNADPHIEELMFGHRTPVLDNFRTEAQRKMVRPTLNAPDPSHSHQISGHRFVLRDLATKSRRT